MKGTAINRYFCLGTIGAFIFLTACMPGKKNSNRMKNDNSCPVGTYAYDVAFLSRHGIETIELKDAASGSRVLVAPGLQGFSFALLQLLLFSDQVSVPKHPIP